MDIEKEIIVHVVCHTHDDPGWLWTLDDYYQGTDGCKVSVKKILDNMLISLNNNKERKFSYVEMSFFMPWYYSQPEDIKNKVKELIKEKRLEFVNGGYAMHDEACVYYEHIMDNMRLGLEFLKKEFDVEVKIGWFIDPFGHSSANAHLMAQMGFDKLVLTRINYQEKEMRKKNRNMEIIYNPFGSKKILTHISYDHYCPSKTLRRYPCDESIVLNKEELEVVCQNFYNEMVEQSKAYRHNNILLYYGDDFCFTEAEINYKNIEQIMKYVNKNMKGKMKLIYSTPSQYFNSVENSGCNLEEYGDFDFFPYADNAHCFWTGYFSSRANLKGLIKQLGIYISNTTKLLCELSYKGKNSKNKKLLKEFNDVIIFARERLGILQHHDAITGTAKEKVNKDYEHMAIIGIEKLKRIIEKMGRMLDQPEVVQISCGYEEKIQNFKEEEFLIMNPGKEGKYLMNIPIEYCDDNESFEYVIKTEKKDIKGNNINFYDKKRGLKYSSIQFEMNFIDKDLFIPITIIKTDRCIKKNYLNTYTEKNIELINGWTYQIENHKLLKNDIEIKLSHEYYTSYTGNNSSVRPQSSNPDGAYIFAPCENNSIPFSIDSSLSFIQHSNDFDFDSLVFRYEHSYLLIIIPKDGTNIHIESIFDPYIKYSNDAYNYILTMSTNIDNTNQIFNRPQIYTDSQGINMIQRIKDTHPNYTFSKTEEVTSNFYPVTSMVSLCNAVKEDKKITIYTDRAQSAGVVKKGEIQLICQRFSLQDDWKGVGEGLFENSSMIRFFSVKHLISIDSDKNNSSYFNQVPLLYSLEDKGKKTKSNLNTLIENKDLNTIFEVKDIDQIFVQVENNYCDYFKESGKANIKFKINHKKGRIDEYNLNGVRLLKEGVNDEREISQLEYKLYLLNFDN